MGLMQSRTEGTTEEANDQVVDIRWWLSQRLRLLDTNDQPRDRKHFLQVCVRELCWQIQAFNYECRFLVMLADVGRFVGQITRTIETILDVLEIREPQVRAFWHQQFLEERNRLMKHHEGLLANEMVLALAMGDRKQQLEVLTLMKFGLDKFEKVMAPREVFVISRTYVTIARLSGLGDVEVPGWFSPKGNRAVAIGLTKLEESEEECARQAALWSRLNHPNVLRFYHACHVGVPRVCHDNSVEWKDFIRLRIKPTWNMTLGWALGLQYLHGCGLVYGKLSGNALHLLPSTRQGVLSGLGLQQCYEADSETKTEGREPSFSDEIATFGHLIYDFVVTLRFSEFGPLVYDVVMAYRDVSYQSPSLPDLKPECLSDEEWDLITRMCGTERRLSINEVVHRMVELGKQEEKEKTAESNTVESAPMMTFDQVASYFIGIKNRTVDDILRDIGSMCNQLPDNCALYERLQEIYTQLRELQSPVPVTLVESYVEILCRAFEQVEQRSLGGLSLSSTASDSALQGDYRIQLNKQVDRLIAQNPAILHRLQTHDWRSEWGRSRQRFREVTGSVGSVTRPPWFLSPVQVERGEYISRGGFGAVFHAKWFDTQVVVKQLLIREESSGQREDFQHEANVWFRLDHPCIIKLYGACDIGHPFFVCERAANGTLPTFLKANPDHRRGVWNLLIQAAEGLNYLHENGIIHGDLKGNNILVCELSVLDNFVKITDFGLCNVQGADGNVRISGAIRWQAPELLDKARPTYASDIYSFGMCIIEVVTGNYPWWKIADDSAVANHVKNGKLPSQPSEFNEKQWHLIRRMCCLNPAERICSGAVVELLQQLCWER